MYGYTLDYSIIVMAAGYIKDVESERDINITVCANGEFDAGLLYCRGALCLAYGEFDEETGVICLINFGDHRCMDFKNLKGIGRNYLANFAFFFYELQPVVSREKETAKLA
ncbi:hypothetical protein KQX54_005909 [Cotesia glomerata]|uniref:Uncharacterized protein n=1 Tax=Cotesia glomerata TaxID=32391 RepID=A0AAV7IQ73_COTGL|nr:hypothetical protein KQX54_005909 [Cotesia glomerata]